MEQYKTGKVMNDIRRWRKFKKETIPFVLRKKKVFRLAYAVSENTLTLQLLYYVLFASYFDEIIWYFALNFTKLYKTKIIAAHIIWICKL